MGLVSRQLKKKVKVKKGMRRQLVLIATVMSVLSAEVVADAARLYRYNDANGRVVLNDHVPPQLIPNGYTILNSRGQVVKVVPRSLTEEEIEQREGSKEEREQKALQSLAQEKSDQRLLTIFSHPSDAERARERKIEALDVIISINKSNILRLRSEFDNVQGQAAAKEREGKEVAPHMLEKIERIERQIIKLEETNAEKEKEKVVVRESYAKDIARLKTLIEQGRK